MKSLLTLWVLGLVTTFVLTSAQLLPDEENLLFGIYRSGDRIGDISIMRSLEGETMCYRIDSESNFRIIWAYQVTTFMNAVYRNNILQTSFAEQRTNNEVKQSGKLHKQGSNYACITYPGTTFIHTGPVRFSMCRLYFEEPSEIPKVFSESHLMYCSIDEVSEGVYNVTLPDGSKNRYVYKNGELQEITIDRKLFTLVFKRE